MITIICGEDVVTSRRFFTELRLKYTQKGYEIKDVAAADVREIAKWMGESVSLFSSKQVFFVERLESSIIRKRGRKSSKPAQDTSLESVLTHIAENKAVELIDWEEKGGREIKLKDIAAVKEFKPSKSIFKLLDVFMPGNKVAFIDLLRQIAEDQDENFIFIMLYRHVRTLILAHEKLFARTVQPWQQMRLSSQASCFSQKTLVDIYQALYRIEKASKTGTNPHGIRKSLEILACYYL